MRSGTEYIARRILIASALGLLLVFRPAGSTFASGAGEGGVEARLALATTTSTENSGLLEKLLPPFEKKHNVVVDVIAVGTGQAITLGRTGDADVLLVHAPELEEEFVAEGYGVERVTFMHNDFVLTGPPDDPAGAAGARDVPEAFMRIADANASFVSRGDSSGTHLKELEIWSQAGVDPEGRWYREVGQGMGEVMTIANDQRAYTLVDRGTYLSYRADLDSIVLLEGDEILFNPYAVIAVNPELHPHAEIEYALALVEYLVSQEGRNRIAEFTVDGEQLFFPDRQ